MKNYITALLFGFLVACSSPEEKKTGEHSDHSKHMASSEKTKKSKSPKQTVMANVGSNHMHLEYHSPSKRGRQIFGGLVAYGDVWVTGAHRATSIQFSEDVEIGGEKIAAGKYAIFTIPGENEWTVIINKNWDQHLADDYDEVDDVIRFTVAPQKLDTVVESLTYEIMAKDENVGAITIAWDDIQIAFEVNNI